jgi:hypothetical protein
MLRLFSNEWATGLLLVIKLNVASECDLHTLSYYSGTQL